MSTRARTAKIIRSGYSRVVILIGPYAVKIPNFFFWKGFLYGLVGNMHEVQWYRHSSEDMKRLCPIRFAIPGGWLVVMSRARDMTRDEWDGFDAMEFIGSGQNTIPVEPKMNSFGWLDGRIVAVDYGGGI